MWLTTVAFAMFAKTPGVENLVADLPPAAALEISSRIETTSWAILRENKYGRGDQRHPRFFTMNVLSTVTVRHRFVAHWITFLFGLENLVLIPQAVHKLIGSLWRVWRSTYEPGKTKDVHRRRDILGPLWLTTETFAVFAGTPGVENLVADLPPAAALEISSQIETRSRAILNPLRGMGDTI